MTSQLESFARAAWPVVMCLALVPSAAQASQTAREQAAKELARKTPAGSVQACTLITRADVQKATGRNPYVDPEPAGQGGWICNVGIGAGMGMQGTTPEQWDHVFAVNARSHFLLAAGALRTRLQAASP